MLLRKSYTDALNETNVRNTILSARSLYFEGMPFDNSKYYFSPKLFPGVNYTAYGCAAFAVELSDKAFDDLPARHHFNFNKIRVGDIVRIDSNKHSAIVIDVNGNEITIAEANFNNSVHWGRKLNINDPTVGWSYVLTRYPE